MRFMLLSLRTPACAAHPDPHSRSRLLSQPNPEFNRVIHDVHVHSITMTTPAVLTSRLRTTGQCPPSLLDTDGIDLNDEFLKKVSNLVQDGVKLGDNATVEEFQNCMKLTFADAINGSKDQTTKEKMLIQRRAIALAIIASTPTNSVVLKDILNNGLLFTIKSWLDEILNVGLGGVDLLLHLLGSISMLPVSKEMVTKSKLGKHLTVVEKNKICSGSMNETAIRERVSKVKEEWTLSVKRLKKEKSTNPDDSSSSKRRLDSSPTGASKKSKPNEPGKKSYLSSYLSKVSGADAKPEESAAEQARRRAKERAAEIKKSLGIQAQQLDTQENFQVNGNDEKHDSRQERKSVKWADKEGGPLTVSRHVDLVKDNHDANASLTDRKRKDRSREKELLQNARKSKLVDRNDSLDTMAMMYSSNWQQPKQIPLDNENPPVQVNSKELNDQLRRILSSLPANFLSEEDVPSNPTPLSEVEQAVDMASQVSAVTQKIPFFADEPEPPAALPPAAVPAPSIVPPLPTTFAPPPPAIPPSIATAEVVQSMGLPPFLAGQNTQALQTLAASPGLLNAFVDMNGNYDQGRIMNLVQTLTANIPGAAPVAVPPPQHFNIPPPPPVAQNYGSQSFGQVGTQSQMYQAPPPQAPMLSAPGPFPNTSSAPSTEGNLHLSGYGPMTTNEMIIQLFSPYVKVDELVPKNGFMFLNTSDAEGAKRAKEALTGVMVGGGPLRINPAVRRNKNQYGGSDSSQPPPVSIPTPVVRDALGQIDYNSVRDDRGNAATRNLFVAGYGPATTDAELRQIFGQHCQVTGIVMKGTFSFVNTSEKKSAVDAREALVGVNINGGNLRINFAKESGRLGTSFDNSIRQQHHQPPQQTNYYGRSF